LEKPTECFLAVVGTSVPAVLSWLSP
jgi:hypothetical protein